MVHLSHAHMWDEVQLHFRSASSFRNARKRAKAVHHQTLVQRGVYSIMLKDGEREHHWQEQMIHITRFVEGTSANALQPAILDSISDLHSYDDFEALSAFLKTVSSMTFMPMCDRGSGNMLFLKRLCWIYENVYLKKPETQCLFFFVETCNVHAHHRTKI
eukprot:9475789-Pyramimonas_sp.AAC.1